MKTWDAAVIGAGCFGAWTAWSLRRKGLSVVLVDKYGPANARSSSGGESRIIRMGYGPDELYTRMSLRSLAAWQRLAGETREPLFHPTGVLWLARAGDRYTADTLATLARVGVSHEALDAPAIRARYPQFVLDDDVWGIFEPESGALMARRAVQAVVREAVRAGVEYRTAAVAPPEPRGRLPRCARRTARRSQPARSSSPAARGCRRCFPVSSARASSPRGRRCSSSARRRATSASRRRGCRPGSISAPRSTACPTSRRAGSSSRPTVTAGRSIPTSTSGSSRRRGVERVRAFLARRFPALAAAPLVETRVCQYENTSNGDFLIDRHPDADNAWLVGGGSGHGFKHGPAVGEYVAERLLGGGTPGAAIRARHQAGGQAAGGVLMRPGDWNDRGRKRR